MLQFFWRVGGLGGGESLSRVEKYWNSDQLISTYFFIAVGNEELVICAF
jgi:hypothetical protein